MLEKADVQCIPCNRQQCLDEQDADSCAHPSLFLLITALQQLLLPITALQQLLLPITALLQLLLLITALLQLLLLQCFLPGSGYAAAVPAFLLLLLKGQAHLDLEGCVSLAFHWLLQMRHLLQKNGSIERRLSSEFE